MDATAPGLWLCPTRGRVHTSLPRTLAAMKAMGISTPGIVIVNDADYAANSEAYDALDLPSGWTVCVGAADTFPDKERWALAEAVTPDMQWLGWIGDDCTPETPDFDARMIAQLTGWNFVTVDDRLRAPDKLGTCVAFSADLVRTVGYLSPPGIQHMFADDCWEALGRDLGIWHVDMGVTVRHVHASVTGVQDDTAKKAARSFVADQAVFADWNRGERHEAGERILRLMEEKGLKLTKPDFTGMKIMLAVPAADGRYEGTFMRSWVASRDAVKHFGGDIVLHELPYQSDICVARNTLFSDFLRSDCTHCVTIDSDQGWTVKDLIRLLVVKKDFVAAAGVKKCWPPAFAVNNSDAFGNAVNINHVSEEGLIEVTHVGFAFACVTKHWAIRMSQHFADLAYDNLTRTTDYGIFMPMLLNRRYLGEDFSACERWRSIGGKIYVAPEISLEHVGVKVFSGAWLDQLRLVSERERAEAA